MPCLKCMAFIYDTLNHPPKLTSPHYKQFKQKRMIGCIEPITYLLARHIEKARPDLHEWLNMMEMMNCAVLNQSATRDYRMFQIWSIDNPDIDYIMVLLIENCILAKCKDRFIYEEWFAEKFIMLLAQIRHIHLEHTRFQPVFQKPADDYNGLYD